MHDSGDRTEQMLDMWSRVKGDNANTTSYVIFGIVVVAVIAAVVMGAVKRQKKGKKKRF